MSRITDHRTQTLDDQEWNDLMNMRAVMAENPLALGADAMEHFTELLVRSLNGKGDPPFNSQ